MVATDRAATARREPKFSGRQNGSRQDRCRVGPRVGNPTAARPLLSARAFRGRRRGGRRTPPHRRPASRARGAAALGARHAHGAQYAGRGFSRRGDPAAPRCRVSSGNSAPTSIAVVLEHHDPALSLPLFSSAEADDIVAEWQSWGRVLGLPLLVAEGDGDLREPFARLGALRIEAPTWRRRRRTAIARRRPSRLLRRRPGKLPETPLVHRGEREIIARN